MKNLFKKFILIKFIFLNALMQIVFAQVSNDIKFEHLNVEDGLASNFTSDVIQDNQGFMWFATKNGLCKYDGSEFTIYKHEPANPNSLSNNYTWSLFKDHTGVLWIATFGGGLNKFNPVTEKFTNYQYDANNPNSLASDTIQSVYEDKTGMLWISTYDNGLSKFDPVSETFINYQPAENNPNSLNNKTVTSVYQDDSGILWISTYGGGLNKFNLKTNTFSHYRHDKNNPNSLGNDFLRMVQGDTEGILWLATENGLDRFDPNTETFAHYQLDKANSVSHKLISSIYEDSKGILWLSTVGGGLNKFDKLNNQFIHYHDEPNNPNSLSNNTVFGVHEDTTGTLWIATDNGINKYDPGYNQFAHDSHNPLQPNGLNNNQIGAIYEDNNGVLWIGTKGGGLNKFEPQTVTHYQHDPNNPTSISNNLVIAIRPAHDGALWLATEGGGLNRFDPKTATFKHYKHEPNNPNSLNYDVIWDIDVDPSGNVWIAFIGGGLDKFDPVNETAVHYKHGNANSLATDALSVVKVDSFGKVWIGTDDMGVNLFEPLNNTFVHYRVDENDPLSLSSNVINTIFEDSKGTIWIGTNDGLNKFNQSTQKFTVYKKEKGLVSDSVVGILEDNQGYLWISTDQGLSKFNPQTETFRNYDKRDGLQGNLFLPRSAYKSPTGKLFFGGINGFNAFYPDKLTDNPFKPPVILTDFKLFNESVSIGGKSPLQKPINFTEQIILSYEQSVFSFEFAALNYRATAKNQYAYLMAGFDKEWMHVDSSRRFATYTNLDAGKYTFRVKASNNDGLWNEAGTGIQVIILPPWWQTWWAYTLYTIIILGSILGIFIAQQRKLAHTRAINQRLQEADKLKDEFLANTSHELRTPLNGIIGIAESLIDGVAGQLSETALTNLTMIATSGRRLSTLVNDILDFSKLKQQEMELQLKSVSLREIVEVVLMFSQSLKGSKDVQLINAIDSNLSPALADENRLQQILYNLVGNAIKFTEEGKIVIAAKTEDEHLMISVSDSGIGIPKNKLDRIFEAFEQAEGSTARDYGGTGLGLAVTKNLVELHYGKIWAESVQGLGSQFIFTLPIAKEPASKIPQQSTLVNNLTSTDSPASSTDISTTAPTSQGEFKVLVVDDEPVNRQVLLNHLSLQNYTVIQAANGLEALKMINEQLLKPDLILLDIMMPKMTGYAVCQKIREQFSLHELPILMLTAKNQISDLVTGLDAGANDYLTKPISKDELLARLKTHFKIKSLREENLRMGAELDVSRRLQQMLLPPEKELSQIDSLDIAGFMEPADEVGGDYYDILQHDGSVLMSIGDVTGHGLESGALAIMVQSAVRTLLANNETNSVKFFSALNQMVYHNVVRMNVEKSLTLLLLNYQNGQLRLSGQHEEIIVVRQGELELIDTIDLGFPIGLDDDIADFIAETTISLNPGDVVVLYTDGITEAENPATEEYGIERLCEIVKQNWQQNAAKIREAVIDDVRQYISTQKVYDDITLLVFKQK